jgi:hypothetical protein
MVPRRRSATDHPKFRRIGKVIRRAQQFLSMGLISSSTALSFPLCGVEDHPSDSTASRSHRLAWRVTPRSIRKRSCVRRPLGRTGGAQLARMFRRTDVASMEPSRPQISLPIRAQIIFRTDHLFRSQGRAKHAPTRLPRALEVDWPSQFRCMPDKFRPTIFVPAEENPNG